MKKIMLMSLLAISCSAPNEKSTLNGIIGENSLQSMLSSTGKQGLIANTSGRECNAFLIAPNQVATTLHCVGEDPLSYIGFKFLPHSGNPTPIVDAVYMDDTKDMVVYQTEAKFEHFYITGKVDPTKSSSIVAFDHETAKLMTTECKTSISDSKPGIISHTCDTKPKYSGSPIVQEGKVVGMHIGFNPNEHLNYALNLDEMFNDEVDLSTLEVEVQLEWPHVRSPHIRSPHIRSTHIRAPSLACVAFVTSTDYYNFKAMVQAAKNQGVIRNRNECMGGNGPGSTAVSIISFAQSWTLGLGSVVSYLGTNGAKCACEEVFSK